MILEKIKENERKILTKNIKELKINTNRKFSYDDYLFLFTCSRLEVQFIDSGSGEYLDLTLDYMFPLGINDEQKNDFIIENFLSIINYKMLRLVPKSELILYDTKKQLDTPKLINKYGYLLRKNRRIINLVYSTKFDFLRWKKYCEERFIETIPLEKIEILKKLSEAINTRCITLVIENNIVAQGLVYICNNDSTLYFLDFWWDTSYRKFSLGIYVYLETIMWTKDRNLNFSFCYGNQKYKVDLLRRISR